MITGLGVEALARAELITKEADVVAALTLEALQGTSRAFDYGKSLIQMVALEYVYININI